MTLEDKLKVNELKKGGAVLIGEVQVKKDTRGRYIIVRDGDVRQHNPEDIAGVYASIDDLNNKTSSKKDLVIGTPYTVPDSNLIFIKTLNGFDIYDGGKRIQQNLSERQRDEYFAYRKNEADQKKVEKSRKRIENTAKLGRRKKVLYHFILILSVLLLVAFYALGVKTDGVTFKRENQNLYEVITDISVEKYPGKKFDKFDEVYFTLNFWLHNDNYFMLGKEHTLSDPDIISQNGSNIITISPFTESLLYLNYSDPNGDGNTLDAINMDMTEDFSYSGYEFNSFFRDRDGKYVTKDEIYKRLVLLFGPEIAYKVLAEQVNDDELIITQKDINAMYLLWDDKEVKSSEAYSKLYDNRIDYRNEYIYRNGFIKIFLNHSAKFIHEYSLFLSAGWANWTAIGIFLLYLILWVAIWIFKKDNLKLSKPLTIVIIVLALAIIIPLVLQYLFEGLSKEPSKFLEVIENTKFTTTSTIINFIFAYIIKFANLGLVGIVTIVLPLKVIRYFVLDAISKLDTKLKVSTVVGKGTIVTETVNSTDWSSGR